MNTIEFLSKQEYFSEITNHIARCHSKDFVALATMNIDAGNRMTTLSETLKLASKNGTDVYLAYDAYNFISYHKVIPGPLFFNTKMPAKPKGLWSKLGLLLKELKSAGINLSQTNVPKRKFSSSIAGRSHIKYCIINDTAYIGGCNLSSTYDIDIMAKITNKKLAKIMRDLATQTQQNPNMTKVIGRDKVIKINDQLDLLLDAGQKNRSIIYETTQKLINSAQKSIFMTCQFFPAGPTSNLLKNATNKNVDVKLLYNSPAKHSSPMNILHFFVKKFEQLRLPKKLFANELAKNNNYIHAKVLLNEKEALLGSHNFVKVGVSLGTAEICLHFKTPKYNQQIIDCINKQKNKPF